MYCNTMDSLQVLRSLDVVFMIDGVMANSP